MRLKRGDFDLEGPCACVRVPGIAAKNGKAQAVPLHPALVLILRDYWSAEPAPFAWAFKGHVPNMDTWKKKDLAAAGTPFLDGEGEGVSTSHALRLYALCTHLRDARVGVRDAMTIMRHSDPRLLKVYTDERPNRRGGRGSKAAVNGVAETPGTRAGPRLGEAGHSGSQAVGA